MGTWSHKPFGNDAARDWLWTLEKARNERHLGTSLKNGIGTARKPASDEQTEIAIAAAAIIAAATTEPIGSLPAEAKRWVRERGFSPSPKVRQDAARVVRQIARTSSLRSRWEESGSLQKWLSDLGQLTDTLEQSPPRAPVVRKPRAISGRLSLAKLIRKVNPAHEGPTRVVLAHKLEALADVNAILSGEWQKTALHLLAAQGLLPEAVALVARGAVIDPETPIDSSAATPLELACRNGRANVAEFLLGRGARIFRQVILPGDREFTYAAALYEAVGSGDEATVKLLFEHGLAPDLLEMNGRSLLHYAAESDHPNMVRFLAAKGLDLNQGDDSKLTPLHRAVISNQKECVAALLELGAKPNAPDDEGASPLDFASEKSHREVARILRQHGGVCTYQNPRTG